MRIAFRHRLFCLLLVPAAALAQSGAPAEQDFFADSPLILTVSRMAKPLLESPASVSVVDRQMIEASGARDIVDLFRLVPGMIVGHHSGHTPAVTYHGLGQEFGRQLQVLIDGRSVFIPSFGGVPWANLPLLIQDIERIEIIRGPNAVTYGANAFLATINIITRHAAEDYGAQYSITASDNAHPDIEDTYLRVGSQHDDLDWRLSLGTVADEGFDAINDSKRVAKANFRLDLLSAHNQFWTLQLGTSSSVAGRGFPPTEDTITDIERDEDASNSYLNLQWEGIWKSSTSTLRLTNTRQEVVDNYDPRPLALDLDAFTIPGVTTFIDFDRTSDRTDLEFIQTEELGERLRLVYGAGLRKDKVKSQFLFDDNRFRENDTRRLFGALEWRIDPRWLLDLGVMVEDSDITSQQASPRISLIRKFAERHALRLVASAARRNPILYEYGGDTRFSAMLPFPFATTFTLPTFTGNDELEPEDIESYEIGLRSQHGGGLETDVKLFSYEISNHIIGAEVEVPVDFGPPFGVIGVDTDTAVNAEKTEVQGIEIALGYRPDARFALHTGFSLVDVDSSCAADGSCRDFEDSFPEHSAFISGLYRFDRKHEVSAALYYLGEISWLDSEDDIDPVRRLDLRYAYRPSETLTLELIGQNLLEDFEDYESENVHDQVVYLRLSGGF